MKHELMPTSILKQVLKTAKGKTIDEIRAELHNRMPTFQVFWSKAYVVSGTTKVKAHTAEEAYDLIDREMGDYEGSLQYCPDDNIIEVMEDYS